MDHEPPRILTSAYIRRIREIYKDADVRQVNLEELFDRLRGEKLPVKHGELIETAKISASYLHLLTHTLSSRVGLKIRNDKCQSALALFLEPLIQKLKLFNITFNKNYAAMAWRHLLQNHPHDSICGCSIDRVHEEMGYRFSQVESIAEAIEGEAVRCLSGGAARFLNEENRILHVFNPLPYERVELIECTLYFDTAWPSYGEPFGYEKNKSFRIERRRRSGNTLSCN